jgi:[protein-PII] uridylyltransferase
MRRPAALVEIFMARMDQPGVVGFSADTMRRIHQATAVHGDALADDREVLTVFLQLLRRGAPAVEALWRMNRHGLLAAILPAFAQVFGRMQYDLFHVYTVDEHTLRVLRNLARFADPAAQREFSLGCEIWAGLPVPEVLLLAGLFHDIAKGRGGDHSVLGEQDARAFCTRLGLPPGDIERVAWLVRWHLLMSTTAQRQDITDPDVVHRFAEVVGNRERLGQLYLLTIADIIGTSPRLWNGWKDRLLADLYTSTRYALRSDVELPRDIGVRVRECSEYALALLLNEGHAEADVVRVWADFPQLSFLRHRPEQVAWQTAAILQAQGVLPLVAVHPLSVRGSTELFVYTPDRDGLFATVTAVLDRLRFSVMEARILSSPTGMALDTFLLLDADSQQPVSAARAEELQQRLQRALAQSAGVQPSKRGMSRHQKHFQMTPKISFHAAGDRTQLALVGTDRPGLLAAVAQVMLATGVRVHDARIATFGERVEDFFQLTDRHDAPLDADRQERLLQALLERIGPARD